MSVSGTIFYKANYGGELTLVRLQDGKFEMLIIRDGIHHWIRNLVQIYDERNGVIRLSINRVTRHKGQWADKMTWDELQAIKHDVGFGDYFAVEIYPKDKDVVNVANMRHLWVLPRPLGFAWVNKSNTDQ